MAGWFQNGICYAEQAHAIDAHFQAIQPFYTQNLTDTQVIKYVKQAGGSWYLTKNTTNQTGVTTNNYSVAATIPTQSSCESPDDHTTQFKEGVELGWAVAGVMLIVFLIRRTYRGF